MERFYSCFFTGHRKISENKKEKVNELLDKKIKDLIEFRGVEYFICGGAIGFDTMAAQAVIRAKRKYPYIKLYLYLPCYDQSKFWTNEDKYTWHMLLTKVDKYSYITENTYTPDCMHKRNRKMADDAVYGIAFCIHKKSGTGATIRYAEQKGCIVENIADDIYT